MNDLIINNIEWARNLAKRKKRNFPHIPLEELESAAFTGLVESAKKFTNSNAPFFSYASKRIRGEMDDYLRQYNMGWNRIRPVKVVGIEDMDFEDQHEDRMGKVHRMYEAAIDMLPPEGRRMFKMYYEDGMTMKQIGQQLGISESMVSIRMKGLHDSLSKRRKEILEYANDVE